MSLFRSEEDVDEWCRRTGEAKGDILTLEHVWRLSLAWYGSRMDESYHGRSRDEVRRLFAEQGLASAFWQY